MRWSLPASFLIHAAILVAAIAVVASPDARRFEVEDEAIPVDIVDIEDVSKRQAVSREAKPEPEQPPAPPRIEDAQAVKPAPKPAEEIKQAAREPEPLPLDPAPLNELIEAAAEPAPEPEPQPVAEPEPRKAEPKPVPVPKKKPTPPRKLAEKPKAKFDPDELAALLNKIDGPRQAPPKPAETTGQPRLADFTSLSGTDDTLAPDLIDALRRRIESCWNIPAGVRDAQDLQIRIQVSFNQDGTLASNPLVINSSSHPAFDAAARSAQIAVKVCEPYNFLPIDKYDLWRNINLTFDPSRMLALN